MSIFPDHWTVQHPDRIQLYALTTPNGVKAGIALEEMELPYEAHKVDFSKRDQFNPGYLKVNPNNKIPSIIDPNGPNGEPIAIMESGAILYYLANKTGKLIPSDPAKANQVLQWMFFQAGSVGPMFGQYGHFVRFAPQDQDHTYAVERYTNEARRILNVIETRLEGRDWLVDDYSVADIMIAPWINAFNFYGGPVKEALSEYNRIQGYLERFTARPGVQRGSAVYN
ncbi:MAG: glutathione S-transferase N-terminal domain-containing protein [Myxococcota bacterium]